MPYHSATCATDCLCDRCHVVTVREHHHALLGVLYTARCSCGIIAPSPVLTADDARLDLETRHA